MLVGFIKNKDNSYEYLDLIGNNLYCTHLDSSGFSKSDLLYIKDVFKELFYSKKGILLGNYNNYEVYYDNINNIKHFVRESRENFDLFFEFNGYNNILYNNTLHNILNKTSKIFVTLTCTVCLSFGFSNFIQNPNKDDFYIEESFSNIYSQEEIIAMENMGMMNYDMAIKYIKESNIDNSTKEILSNKELLEDIFSYYNGTPLVYSANLKFKDIKIDYYSPKNDGEAGYYYELTPNIIHVSKKYIEDKMYKNQTTSHEYVHLLQAEGCPYVYLMEASAELITKEYFNYQILTYKPAVKNLMLLIDIIGPEPVMELLFSGNSSKFTNVLENNLDKDAYNLLIDILQDSSLLNDHYEENKNIQELLCILYKNIYGKDIKEDKNINYDLVYNNENFDCTSINKYYLNTRKMQNSDSYEIVSDLGLLKSKKLIKEVYIYTYKKNVTYNEYINFKDEYSFEYNVNSRYGNIIKQDNKVLFFKYKSNNNIVSNEEGDYISLEQAYNLGYVSIIAIKEDNNLLDNDWTLVSRGIKYVSTNNNFTISNFGPKNYLLNVNTIGIKERFYNQYNSISNKRNQDIINNKTSLT